MSFGLFRSGADAGWPGDRSGVLRFAAARRHGLPPPLPVAVVMSRRRPGAWCPHVRTQGYRARYRWSGQRGVGARPEVLVDGWQPGAAEELVGEQDADQSFDRV